MFKIWYDTESMMNYAIHNKFHRLVLAFLKMRPNAWYCDRDKGSPKDVAEMLRDASKMTIPYPNSGAWETVSNDLLWYEAILHKNEELKEKGLEPLIGYKPDLDSFASVLGPVVGQLFYSMMDKHIPDFDDLIEGRVDFPEDPMERWMCAVMCGQKLTIGNSLKVVRRIKNLNPEMVQVFIEIGGVTAMEWFASEGKAKPVNGMIALESFPGFTDELFNDSRYARATENDTGGLI